MSHVQLLGKSSSGRESACVVAIEAAAWVMGRGVSLSSSGSHILPDFVARERDFELYSE